MTSTTTSGGLDLAVWAHRWSSFYPKVIGSIGRFVRESYRLIVVIEPGNCHENMDRAIKRSNARFLCFFDEDVELFDPYTIPRLLNAVRNRDIAICAPLQIYTHTPHIRDEYIRLMNEKGPPPQEVLLVSWCAAYCMMIDRSKVPDLYGDTNIPFPKGMTDIDICHQATSKGYYVAIDQSVAVSHQYKGDWAKKDFDRYQSPTTEEYIEDHFPGQEGYMRGKWGNSWRDYKGRYEGVMDEVPSW